MVLTLNFEQLYISPTYHHCSRFPLFLYLLYSHLLYGTIQSEISGSKYKALIGGKVELPCNVSTNIPNDAISTIFWYKGDTQGSPIYTVDARNSSNLDGANRFTSDYLKERVTFNVSVQFAFLIISPVRDEDNGEYRCRVDFRWSRTINTIVYLEVIVPAKKLIITDETNHQITDLLGSYSEGSSLKLKCIAYGGKPAPNVHWYADELLIDDTYTTKISEDGLISINELSLPKLGRSDMNKILTCKAFNTNLTQSISKSLTLNLNLYPLYVKIISIRRPLSSGKPTELQCNSKGSRPPAKITWYLNQKPLSASRDLFEEINGTTSILKLVPSITDNGALLSCRAENVRLVNSSIKDDWILNIYYMPKVKLVLRLSTNPIEIKEKDEVIFECEIDSNPGVKKVGWMFNDQPLIADESGGIIIDNTTLVIKVVERSHSGEYSCSASNIEGKGISNKVRIKVNHSPICKKDQKTIYIAGLGESVRISCSVEAEPKDVEIVWKINDTHLDKGIYLSDIDSLQSSIIYRPRRDDDYGTLMCLARNKAGAQHEPCRFMVMPAGRPEGMRNCVISNQTWESIIVECEAGHDGGLNQTFYLQVYDYRREKLLFNLTRNGSPSFHVNGLTSAASYVLDVYSSNPKGSSNTTTLIAQTLSMQKQKFEEHLTDIKFNPYLAILSALVSTLVLVAIIIILIITIRNREEKCDSKKKNKDQIQDIDMQENQGPDVVPSTKSVNVGSTNISLKDNNASHDSESLEARSYDVDIQLTDKKNPSESGSNVANIAKLAVMEKNIADGSSFDGEYGFTQITSIDDFDKCITRFIPFDKFGNFNGPLDSFSRLKLEGNSTKRVYVTRENDSSEREYTFSTPV